MGKQITLDRLPQDVRGPVLSFLETAAAIFREKLVAAIVYGAAAAEGFNRQTDHIHSAIVLSTFELERLRELAGRGQEFNRLGIAAPVILTPAFLAGSRDTFPLELIEMQQRHVTVLGEDPVASLSFEDAAVARQCERELKVILIGMQQRLLAAAGDDRHLHALSRDSAEHLCRTIRGLLWIKGVHDAVPAAQLAARAEAVLARKLPGLAAAIAATSAAGWPLFKALYDDVARLCDTADGL